ncbi:MAG: cytochrome c [Dechloromonas sp.]|uniref:c-type cytochrome n=1 Tax=Azonexaceae TaxID=2008795 RepID=UPI001CF81104|nr:MULTISPECIES: cytochrome c [Azonexaceae]MBT9521287.1 cytochrome c [Dechloromonas sp.]UCV21695.1 cytochrome c [Ferribacterium limneticum]
MDRFSTTRMAVLSLFLTFSFSAQSAAPPADSVPTEAATSTEHGLPPFKLDDESRIAAGKARFGANCAAYCHGNEGSGGKVPSFKGRKDLNAEAVFKVITHGRRGADVMPAWGNGFSAEKRWELVAYIMYLSTQTPDK